MFRLPRNSVVGSSYTWKFIREPETDGCVASPAAPGRAKSSGASSGSTMMVPPAHAYPCVCLYVHVYVRIRVHVLCMCCVWFCA